MEGVSRKNVFVKLHRDVVREVDIYAARHDLYRNEAMERLLRLAVSQGGGSERGEAPASFE
jgi:hypothetical protein